MNSALTRPQSLQELYKTYFSFANRFKFTDLLKNYIQNEEWKDKSQQPVWDLLSKISDDIGAVLTDDIVNYTRNVVDINTCKVPQLIEQAWMLSYHLDHLKNTYGFLPKRIQCLVDLFSINPEYLVGNHKNHILSDEVIKDLLIYIRDNVADKTPFANEAVMDKLLENPHSLIDMGQYRNFVIALFYASIANALSATYSAYDDDAGDQTPIAFNLLWEERKNQQNIISRLDEYKSWVDKYIWNEIEYPLNDSGLANTIWNLVEQVKSQKQMSSKFNPFKIADHIYFNGLNPTHSLSNDELDLVETVLDYHAKTKYNYETQQFVDDISTKYAYYKELEWCEYVKLVMFVMNNIQSFNMTGLTYEVSSNKFIQKGDGSTDCLRVVKIFNQGSNVVQDNDGKIVLDRSIILKVATFLCDLVFHIQETRENIKTIAHKHAMRGSGALLVHIVNDFLIKELPIVRDMVQEQNPDLPELKFLWEINPEFNNYGNVKVLEYDDDNEYFNIDPSKDVRFTERTNARYWEQLDGLSDSDSLGVLTKGQIKDFYRNVLGMGRLQPDKPSNYDDVCDFLVGLFKIGANPVEWKKDEGEFYNPIDDFIHESEEKYGYSKQERLEVQQNTELRKNQERQFLEYSGNDDIVGDSIYDYVNNKLFYWKNTDYSSHVLHPFMYNLKLWNKLNNIIINGYKDYVNNDLVEYLSSKVKFDELFGKFGECRNFWKYNVMDLTGYTTRYEAAIKDEHKDDFNNTSSPLTGYDGLFYPQAAEEFLDALTVPDADLSLPQAMFTNQMKPENLVAGKHEFIAAICSIYWQEKTTRLYGWNRAKNEWEAVSEEDSFYTKWYSHLNYTRSEYQRIAIQLWYWRDRIRELITTQYPITKYCLDIQGNSLVMVSTFHDGEEETNPYLIDLTVAQNNVQQNICGNRNTHVSFCEDRLRKPSELWIRWKSNPIAVPAFDVYYDDTVGDRWFDFYYRNGTSTEFGQIVHTNSQCNEWFKLVLLKWREDYRNVVHWTDGTEEAKPLDKNRLPVFFDMEQSANVLALASWYKTPDIDPDGIINADPYGNPKDVVCCGKNPLHILSLERTSELQSEYSLSEYTQEDSLVNPRNMMDWIFDAYHYCQANGSILVPLYNFVCADGDEMSQNLKMRLFVVPAQTLKQENHSANDRLAKLDDMVLDLNRKIDFDSSFDTYRFNHPMKVCRNTNVVFSVYDSNGLNKVKCAFLGTFQYQSDDGKVLPEYSKFKVSSCDAQTRYEYDSQSVEDLALTSGFHFKGNDIENKYEGIEDYEGKPTTEERRRYIDRKILEEAFNSYDSNDKYVFVVDIQASIDHKSMFNMSWENSVQTYSYNILGDAGYIPHFAYQSLVRYGKNDRLPNKDGSMPDGGIAFTWRNAHLDRKDHLQFELLGLDDKDIPEAFKNMLRMVVTDTTDDCKTLINPARMMDDIYRVWCETIGVRRSLLPGEDDPYGYKAKYESYLPNEYVDYSNPELDWSDATVQEDGSLVKVWNVCDDPDNPAFTLDLPVEDQGIEEDPDLSEEEKYLAKLEAYRNLLDEYYVYVLRTEDGTILNEKKYILPPTRLSEFFFGKGTDEGYIQCSANQYKSSLVEDNHFVPAQVLFVGTPNPFRYDANGEHVWSKPEELQYGNGVLGVGSIELKIDILDDREQQVLRRDEHGNVILAEPEKVVEVLDDQGRVVNRKIQVTPDCRTTGTKKISPTVKFTKFSSDSGMLCDRINANAKSIGKGQVTVVFSHKNPDNIAKYHILNRFGNLYFSGSLPKNGKNQFKYSDFKFGQTVHLVQDSDGWKSTEVGEDGEPVLKFKDSEVRGNAWVDGRASHELPPYFLGPDEDTPEWFLEQGQLEQDGEHPLTKGEKTYDDSERKCHVSFQENGVKYPVPGKGNFKWAHKVKARAQKYLDYLYVKNHGLSFKVSEESQSYADLLSKFPPFHVDNVMRNKMGDLNDIRILKEYSTFIHQSEKPQRVKDCPNFNPMLADVILNYGLEQREMHRVRRDEETNPALDDFGSVVYVDDGGNDVEYDENGNAVNPLAMKVICTEDGRPIELDNSSGYTRLNLQLDDGEIDDCLKIYTNYVRVPDAFGEYHYDLYFNVQNLFSTPFEYISSVTGQPNALILPDSYLYLTGDKYKKVGDHNEVDKKKLDVIKQGGELVLYGQMKTYSDNKLSYVKTMKLFAYRVWNISDDKPKFLIKKTYDITKSRMQNDLSHVVDIKFSDVMWSVDESQFKFFKEDGQYSMEDQFKELNRDVIVVQPIDIRHNWRKEDDFKINQISFDIVNDVIDFNNTPELCEYWMQARTLRNWDGQLKQDGLTAKLADIGYPHYDHWSDRYMKLEVNKQTGVPRMTLTYDPQSGFNFERIYLKWRLPAGCRVLDTLDRLGGYVFSSTAQNVVAECNNNAVTPMFNISTGYVTARVHRPGEMYLGLEHSTKMRKNGYLLTGLADAIRDALFAGEANPTLRNFTITESEIKAEVGKKMNI